MPRWQISVGGLMGFVLIAAIICGAVRDPSPRWAGALLLVTWGILTFAVVGAICQRGKARAWWLGFALFGWGYLTVASGVWGIMPARTPLPTTLLLRYANPIFGKADTIPVGATTIVQRGAEPGRATSALVVRPPGIGGPGLTTLSTMTLATMPLVPVFQIGHYFWVLTTAVFGGLLCRFFFARPGDSTLRSDISEENARSRSTRIARRRPLVFMLAGLALNTAALAFALWWGSEAAGCFTLVVAYAWVGLAVMGALFERGQRRAAWLGAALFGGGYLSLALHSNITRVVWPLPERFEASMLATAQDYEGIPRIPNAPLVANGEQRKENPMTPQRRRTLEALERPVPMIFPQDTPLKAVLDHIRAATRSPELPDGVPIYVDPNALMECDKTENSPVRLELRGVPLKLTLRLLLMQLNLDYVVKDGLVLVETRPQALAFAVERDDARALGTTPDPGHDAARGTLALIAACVGVMMARLA